MSCDGSRARSTRLRRSAHEPTGGGWDLSQFGGGQANTWTQVEAFFHAFPEHEVLNGGVVDDTSNPLVGKVYFDLVTVGNETIADHSDTNK